METNAFESLREFVARREGVNAGALVDYISAYFSNTDATVLQARGAEFLVAQASAHLRLLDASPGASGARVRVFNPTPDEDGFVSEHTIVQIIQDDMPFLVDSVTMAVNSQGHVAHWIVHPLLSVELDPQRRLVGVTPAAQQVDKAKPIQSFISIECDRLVSASDRQALALELERVLHDVHDAVEDWEEIGRAHV